MPNRMIRESCRTSDTLNQLSAEAERLFWRLTTVADDFGRFEADPRVILATCFPLKVGLLKVEAVTKWFAELVACSLVRTYVSGSKQLAFFVTWEKYQYTRAKTSKYPPPTDANICSQTLTDSPVVTERHGSTEQHEDDNGNTSPRAEEPWGSPADLVALYNATAPDECPAVSKLSPGRTKKARAYLAAFPERQFWKETCEQIRASRFLRGLRPSSNGHEHFVADFDWLLTKGKDGSENCVKVYEGKYHD